MITVVDVDVVDVDVFLSCADLLYTIFMCVYVRASIYVVAVDVAVHVSTSAL